MIWIEWHQPSPRTYTYLINGNSPLMYSFLEPRGHRDSGKPCVQLTSCQLGGAHVKDGTVRPRMQVVFHNFKGSNYIHSTHVYIYTYIHTYIHIYMYIHTYGRTLFFLTIFACWIIHIYSDDVSMFQSLMQERINGSFCHVKSVQCTHMFLHCT